MAAHCSWFNLDLKLTFEQTSIIADEENNSIVKHIFLFQGFCNVRDRAIHWVNQTSVCLSVKNWLKINNLINIIFTP